jgi:hypothetical protein
MIFLKSLERYASLWTKDPIQGTGVIITKVESYLHA